MISSEIYAPFCRDKFALRHEDGSSVELTLTEVKNYRDDEIQRTFSLFFRGPEPLVPQGTHRLGHPKLGDFDLFLVPIQRVRDGFVYEAVFNLLKEEAQN